MTFILDSLLNSDVVFYSVFTVIAGGLSYSLQKPLSQKF